ncbi:MAG: right-handed parallel beta-helix repeat-containing protein [Candidatus Eisenbacteria bacterium]|nr:right-handed parallel beta-helix repeat-containing protein [Candidatus Eisenbacteria bacterium]
MRTRLWMLSWGLMLAAPAAAQNASTAGSLELYPTYQAIGVRLTYGGDLNGNASARIEWRPAGAPAWNAGMPMTRITNSRWAASVLWLSPRTSYEVRVVIDDPDGGGSASATVTTRDDTPLVPAGRTWWVAPAGNDSAAGAATTPLRTLQHAADLAQPGDEIRVRPGIYYQSLDTPRSGTASLPIFLTADAPGVILDGSDPASLTRGDWTSSGGGIWSVPYATAANRLVCADSLQRLYKQATLADLEANANGMTQGFAIEGGRLYVKLEDLSNPTGHVMHVAHFNNALFVDESYWRIRGFDIRYYGMASGGGGVRLRAANGCVLSDNTLETNGGRGIYLNVLASDNRIERNFCFDPRIGGWPWSATKAHEEELAGISARGGRGNVVRFNRVVGTFDGMDTSDGDTDESVGADCDFNDNVVAGVADDAIETDVVSGINLRLWNNRFDRCYSGISVAPNFQGPEYIVYNVVTNTTRGAFKFSLSGTGETWICHNTVTSDVAGSPAVHPSGPYSNIHFRNNILVGRGAAAVSDDAGESVTGNDFDGDLLWTDYAALFRWKGVNYSTISALRSATGFEGVGRAGDPGFVNAAAGDFSLLAWSLAIDAGLILPGINDRFRGAAPDPGAFESGAPDVTPPAAITDLH